MNKFTSVLLLGLLVQGYTQAQIFNPVKWKSEIRHLQRDEYEIKFSAVIEKGWSVYSQYLESDEGPVPTSITYEDAAFERIGDALETGNRKEVFDAIFEMNVIKFQDQYQITQKVKCASGSVIKGYLNYMTCDDTKCLPPTDVEFSLTARSTSGDSDGAAISSPGQPENIIEPITESVPSISGLAETNGLLTPVKWEATWDETADQFVFTATIDDGWNIYDQTISQADGPIPTSFMLDSQVIILPYEAASSVEEKDEYFGGLIYKKIKKSASYFLKNQSANHSSSSQLEINYMACDAAQCIFPLPVRFLIDWSSGSISKEDEGPVEEQAGLFPILPVELDNPVHDCGDVEMAQVSKYSMLNIFFLGFIGGLLALLTPCVFPMIPLTVSFFTKGNVDRQKGIRQATLYGFFILLVYVLLSVPFHLLDSVNPGILNEISTNVTLNIFFFLIFLFFAFSFFGFYEITIPSKWTNKVSNAESVGGIAGIFFMALTLALVSFSCTGPILGSLLAGALTSEGGAMQLTSGMSGFGLALALPFAIFAAFPSMLSSLPKSGGWLNTVKVTLGFLELALAFKFLSNADLVKRWGLLKIEPFLIIWVIIFFGLAIYLFGKWRFPHDSPGQKIGPVRLIFGLISLLFAGYLVTGFQVDEAKDTFKSLTLLSGLAPPAGYSWIYPKKCPNNLDCFKDLQEGLEYAKKVDKPVIIDFTGHACVNCRKMEEHVWPKPGVSEKLEKEFVLISLYVDEKIDLPEEQKSGKMRNYGHKWSQFQAQYFNNNSQPFYVLLTPEGKLLNNPVGYTPDVAEYAAFLDCGLNAFRELRGESQLGSTQQ